MVGLEVRRPNARQPAAHLSMARRHRRHPSRPDPTSGLGQDQHIPRRPHIRRVRAPNQAYEPLNTRTCCSSLVFNCSSPNFSKGMLTRATACRSYNELEAYLYFSRYEFCVLTIPARCRAHRLAGGCNKRRQHGLSARQGGSGIHNAVRATSERAPHPRVADSRRSAPLLGNLCEQAEGATLHLRDVSKGGDLS